MKIISTTSRAQLCRVGLGFSNEEILVDFEYNFIAISKKKTTACYGFETSSLIRFCLHKKKGIKGTN